MAEFISWDLIESYWIFIWFLVYVVVAFYKKGIGRFLYENTNPFFLFLLGFFLNMMMLLSILFFHYEHSHSVAKFILLIVILKAIPLWYLWHQKINMVENILFSIFFLFLYWVYLTAKNKNVVVIYKNIYESIVHEDGKTPFLYFLRQISN